jgi:hypothetical protein
MRGAFSGIVAGASPIDGEKSGNVAARSGNDAARSVMHGAFIDTAAPFCGGGGIGSAEGRFGRVALKAVPDPRCG